MTHPFLTDAASFLTHDESIAFQNILDALYLRSSRLNFDDCIDKLISAMRGAGRIPNNGVLQPWVANLGRRHQGVLVSAMRGCDTAPRHDPSKIIQRLLRASILIPHIGRTGNPKTYIHIEPDEDKWWEGANAFLRSWDHYPNHYVMHFIHATEIIGYHGPTECPVFGHRWANFYYMACNALHLFPETKEQLDERLNADEETFYAQQENR